MKTKICKQCNIDKDIDSFSKHTGFRDGRNSKCKTCKNSISSKYYRENSKNILRRQKKFQRSKILQKYGISELDYENMHLSQSGLCAICGNKPSRRRLAVDHDHKTGRVRQLLCDNCNWILGLSKDNPDILIKSAKYLEKHGKHPSGEETLC